jgi:ATP-dependent helicase/nuclease subunit A
MTPLRAAMDGGHQVQTLPGMEAEGATTDAAGGTSLTLEQHQAVARRAEPLLVSAAAGSGKTSVLVERFVRAVREDGIAPGRILAITFTERAAGELRARVRARLLELGDREAARDTEAAFVGTFHGFCARLLRAHAPGVGLDPAFAILDEGSAGRLRERAFKAALREFLLDERAAAVDLLAAYGVDRVHWMLEQAYRELRSRGQRLPRLPVPAIGEREDADAAADLEAAAACALLDELLERFGLAYERLKKTRAVVDFDDLELLTRELLEERQHVRRAWSDRFELLMVDEFQDTNPRQLGILEALDHGNLFTVGDELQSIYGFRHADVSLFRTRRAELRETDQSLALTQNFRSREPLLQVVNAVFAGRFADYTPLVAGRSDAKPSGNGDGAADRAPSATRDPTVELLLTDVHGWEEHEELAAEIAAGLPHAQTWRQAEARMLARRVAELVHEGHARPGDVVVLLRASGDLEVFERALQLCGLRTLAAVGAFWGHQQIGDLISYLRALANPLDEEALYGALGSPLGGCSMDCLALLANASRAARRGVWETALDAVSGEAELLARLAPEDRDALSAFCTRLQAERLTASRRTIAALIERAIDASGYRQHVLGLDWGERRLANVHKLLRLARRFEAGEGRDLRGFLDHVEHLKEAVKVEPDAPVEGVEADAVRLMTVHAAKGLEFPVVCVADLGRQPNTQTPDLLIDGDRLGVRLVRLDGGRSAPTLDYRELCEERRLREGEEEDRILYVAMTRARERLLLSGAIDFERWPRSAQAATAISWLGPALAEDLPALVRAGEMPLYDLPVGGGGAVHVRCRLSTPATASALGVPEPAATGAPEPSAAGAPEPAATGAPEPSAAGAPEPAAAGAPESPEDTRPTPPDPIPSAAPGAVSPPSTDAGSAAALAGNEDRISSLSYSSLSELERCGYRYYLERVLGLPENRAAAGAQGGHDGVDARGRGTLVHRLLELADFGRLAASSPEEVARVALELGMGVQPDECLEIAQLLDSAFQSSLSERLAVAENVRREHPFAFQLAPEEPLVSGFIDLLAREADGGSLVLDYKSDRVGPEISLEALVERDYGVQRLLYALAVLRDGAPSVEVVHWFLERPDEWVGVRYTQGDREELQAGLAARIARARTAGFVVSQRPHRGLCLTCPGRGGLCSWSEERTLAETAEN